eukprot:4179255-Prymnesium_polylepis.1
MLCLRVSTQTAQLFEMPDFAKYHESRASLQILCQDCNLKKPRPRVSGAGVLGVSRVWFVYAGVSGAGVLGVSQ